ncbi:HAD family phosphatase [uncultured Clostridium sp.]|uniref:HAD family hydrolase n=1 Tax=uncultured Clostridium sp. TaxID=59620 RepID=UPI00262A2906|nr:HAD family phosphatase [uncultured Clostridium sp.]
MFLKNIEAVIFDLDGTLIDSLDIWHQIDIDYLSSKNLEVPPNLHSEIGHLSFVQTAHYFKNRFNLNDSIEILLETWNSMALEQYTYNTPLKPGALKFLTYLKSHGFKIGLATSNSTILLTAALKQNNIFDFFDAITTTSEVDKGKDHPDVYLLAANKLNTDPKNCLVFEDILPAVKGAKSANMHVIAIEDKESLKDKHELISLSDNYIQNYNELFKYLD